VRKNKQDRAVNYKCSLGTKCPNTGISGVYFRDNAYWCSKACWKKSKEPANDKR